ncbi:hypothetical protein VNO78_18630 [Psophocarpus tetragonolobus]|uniref:Cytochrome b5 heme-binding domain-containing protein n=1 Tax=Psophocarpus tetragonolobus TaxID=3891 RepID=A0AAN9SIS5_PSOTE
MYDCCIFLQRPWPYSGCYPCMLRAPPNQNHDSFSFCLSSLTSFGCNRHFVYDITSFLDDHPGGDEVLLTSTGKDATIDFEDVGHSDSAVETMEKYFIGKVDTSTLPAKVNYSSPPPTLAHGAGNQSSGFVVKILQFLLPLLILGVAFALQYYGKKKHASSS